MASIAFLDAGSHACRSFVTRSNSGRFISRYLSTGNQPRKTLAKSLSTYLPKSRSKNSVSITPVSGIRRSSSQAQTLLSEDASCGPTCTCILPPAPSIPSSHPIDTTSSLANTSALYHNHVIISTGQGDWSSKIELEPGIHGQTISALRKALKAEEATLLEQGIQRKVMLGMSSFAAGVNSAAVGDGKAGTGRAMLFPSGEIIDFALPGGSTVASRSTTQIPTEGEKDMTFLAGQALSATDSTESTTSSVSTYTKGITILLCSHGGRDLRCGILGPYLKECIEQILKQHTLLRERFYIVDDPTASWSIDATESRIPVSIGLTSHIGGHKWAGNMIVYFPSEANQPNQPDQPDQANKPNKPNTSGPTHSTSISSHQPSDESHNIKGLWYGRINGDNIEQVLVKTLSGFVDGRARGQGEGMVVEDYCRRIVY